MGSDSSEFREDVRGVIRRHDPDADALRDLAADLERLANRYDEQDDLL